ncbi:MAG: hypothetical protein D6772_13285 [Bacteroidetes bacterium]|nr:MAG: hypothetical protein D6772_13285 [Bacteroidota bacterium]
MFKGVRFCLLVLLVAAALGWLWLFYFQREPVRRILFLGHPYNWRTENTLDPRLEQLPLASYDGIWLGGDVCARTSKSPATLAYLDSIFNLAAPGTHWAIGNHDLMEGDLDRITQRTQRPDYYLHWTEGLAIVVLNTNLFWLHKWPGPQENCERKQKQMAFLHQVLDTISSATRHLVILHHHGLLNEMKVNARGDTLRLDNISAMRVQTTCDPKSSFTAEVYPKLVAIQRAGTQVILLAGDVGMNSKGYHFTTPEGIHLLGSGINNSLDTNYLPDYVTNLNPDTVLFFYHYPQSGRLEWDFVPLDSLVNDK